MSRSVNTVILLGRLGKDVEVKYSPSGNAVAKFSLATSDRYKDGGGEWQEKTEWHNLVAFKRTAEIAGEYLKKGSNVYICGKLQTSSWDDAKSGEKKYRTEIVVNELVMLDGKPDSAEPSAKRTPPPSRAAQTQPARRIAPSIEIEDTDIPF